MSENKHTPEPWHLCEVENETGRIKHLVPVDAEKMSLLTIVENYQATFAAIYNDDDARRIVACVNACAGSQTDALEEMQRRGLTFGQLAFLHARLQQQRDELLAALYRCRFALEPYDDIKPRDWKSDRANLRDAHQVAIAAIATVKGEQ